MLAQGARTVGIGGGLPSRVDAAELAISKAGDESQGAALASDAFFPFPDSIEMAAQAGVRSVIQPGGSIRDAQVIEAADRYDMAMVFTGTRHLPALGGDRFYLNPGFIFAPAQEWQLALFPPFPPHATSSGTAVEDR